MSTEKEKAKPAPKTASSQKAVAQKKAKEAAPKKAAPAKKAAAPKKVVASKPAPAKESKEEEKLQPKSNQDDIILYNDAKLKKIENWDKFPDNVNLSTLFGFIPTELGVQIARRLEERFKPAASRLSLEDYKQKVKKQNNLVFMSCKDFTATIVPLGKVDEATESIDLSQVIKGETFYIQIEE